MYGNMNIEKMHPTVLLKNKYNFLGGRHVSGGVRFAA